MDKVKNTDTSMSFIPPPMPCLKGASIEKALLEDYQLNEKQQQYVIQGGLTWNGC